MKLPPYPKYKPSGVEWLGEVPEHGGGLSGSGIQRLSMTTHYRRQPTLPSPNPT